VLAISKRGLIHKYRISIGAQVSFGLPFLLVSLEIAAEFYVAQKLDDHIMRMRIMHIIDIFFHNDNTIKMLVDSKSISSASKKARNMIALRSTLVSLKIPPSTNQTHEAEPTPCAYKPSRRISDAGTSNTNMKPASTLEERVETPMNSRDSLRHQTASVKFAGRSRKASDRRA
jgi:hypothetical protein